MRERVLANIEASANARSVSNFNQLERFETAYGFYRQAGFDADRTLGHLQGIDFTQPVFATELLPGTNYVQHVLNGRVGIYFAPLGTPAEMLGINPAGRTPLVFAPSQPVPALQSTASRVLDTWTVPSQPFNAAGGGTQFFVPGKGLMIQVPNP
ncbi:MAG: polymorphic toxin type 46 domain-containing protein [Permianibacter sp.]